MFQRRFWSFRKQISVDSMVNAFNNGVKRSKQHPQQKQQEHKLLDEFLRQMGELQAVRYLPSICKMLMMLHSHCKLFFYRCYFVYFICHYRQNMFIIYGKNTKSTTQDTNSNNM